ncbi:pirin family protein [Chryseobacterium nematophagum]|uniref:Pirin family protein n=1 Tax=Chryseobacterium nematophagum TaxID=2305228 RepID=A0A3M7TJK9_9FLAO|nr:pirin family protein [Chryseobacterium nematophagum]RNA63206.1 pirin family protein [Chryseobacterium nematophagum]
METKQVETIVSPQPAHFVGGGCRVHNFIPSIQEMDMKRMDPFILLDYHSKFHFNGTHKPRGISAHPHRGFETVTIAYKGKIQHTDSAGGGGIIDEGDAQWMTAAKGILHKEYHEPEWAKEGGVFQMVQLWVNLPSVYKMSCPKYQAIKNYDMKKIVIEDMGTIDIIAGEYKGQKGPAFTFSPVHVMNVKLKKGGHVEFNFPAHFNTGALVIEGEIIINGQEKCQEDYFALFKNEGEIFHIEANEDSIFLIISGQPLEEPIYSHGPFVMNSKEEIMQAYEDFNLGRFGYLAD